MKDRIHSFADLGPNWDSHGGIPPAGYTIQRALDVADMLSDREGWSVSPNGAGGVLFEHATVGDIWVRPDGRYDVVLMRIDWETLTMVMGARYG